MDKQNIKEAMEDLKHCKEVGNIIFSIPEDEQTIDTIISALEKQMPKKPYDDTCPERTLHKCPTCGYIFVTEYSYANLCAGRKSRNCPECGQAIDWRVEE